MSELHQRDGNHQNNRSANLVWLIPLAIIRFIMHPITTQSSSPSRPVVMLERSAGKNWPAPF